MAGEFRCPKLDLLRVREERLVTKSLQPRRHRLAAAAGGTDCSNNADTHEIYILK
jgi:hypothetical protein